MDNVLVLAAGEDLTSKEGAPIKLDGSYQAVMCDAVTDECIGILKQGGESAADVEVALAGSLGPVRVGGTVKAGQFGTITTGGETVVGAKVDGAVYVCQFMQNGVSGDLVQALVLAPARHEEG